MNHLTDKIYLDDCVISQKAFADQKAQEFSEKYKHIPVFFTPACIHKMLALCAKGEDWPEEVSEEWESAMAEVCLIREKSEAIRIRLETPIEAPLEIVMAESPLGPVIEATDENMVKAARETNMVNGYERLKAIFDFGKNHDELNPIPGSMATALDYSAVIGYGMSMGESGAKITARALRFLTVLGRDEIIPQIAADRGLSYSTISGLLRAEMRVPLDHPARKTLAMTTIQEIVNARYSKDEKENEAMRMEVLDTATEKGMDSDEARSLVKMKKGRDQEITAGGVRKSTKERIAELEQGFMMLLNHYLNGANSGDWGNWNPEEEEIVKESRLLLNHSGS